ncbi:DUF1800 family protein [Paeniglutamicibacter sp. R2-26]|uniref:DUF1800 family protein n=1 Tax=Paeniglutamicibacter sp. R2-26 TaxID=3144417 RepID=UPI003EE52E72
MSKILGKQTDLTKVAKWRRPAEVVATMLRTATITDINLQGNWVSGYTQVLAPQASWMSKCGQKFQEWRTPNGSPHVASHLMTPNIMLNTWNLTEQIANQPLNYATFKPWREVFGLDPKMTALKAVDRITMFIYGHVLPEDDRLSIAAHLMTGDARKNAPAHVGIGDAVLNSARLKDTVRMVFASPRIFIRYPRHRAPLPAAGRRGSCPRSVRPPDRHRRRSFPN